MNASPLDRTGREENQGDVTQELNRVEEQLAFRLKLGRKELRRRLPQMLRDEEVYEDELVSEWLMLYSAAMDYAAQRTSGPRPVARDEEEGPHSAALAAFGP